jgi:hypothetical protein
LAPPDAIKDRVENRKIRTGPDGYRNDTGFGRVSGMVRSRKRPVDVGQHRVPLLPVNNDVVRFSLNRQVRRKDLAAHLPNPFAQKFQREYLEKNQIEVKGK